MYVQRFSQSYSAVKIFFNSIFLIAQFLCERSIKYLGHVSFIYRLWVCFRSVSSSKFFFFKIKKNLICKETNAHIKNNPRGSLRQTYFFKFGLNLFYKCFTSDMWQVKYWALGANKFICLKIPYVCMYVGLMLYLQTYSVTNYAQPTN